MAGRKFLALPYYSQRAVFASPLSTVFIEHVQKRCLKLLFSALSHSESLSKSGLERLDYRRDMITQSMFREIKNSKHFFYYLLPPVKVSHSQMVLRSTYPYQLPLQNYTLWKEFCTILHFQELLPVVLMHSFHVYLYVLADTLMCFALHIV